MSITGGVHFDLVKRVLRDINRSGQAPEEIIQQVILVFFLPLQLYSVILALAAQFMVFPRYANMTVPRHDVTAERSTAQISTAQHSAAQHSAAQHSTAQRSTAQHSTAQHSTAQSSKDL